MAARRVAAVTVGVSGLSAVGAGTYGAHVLNPSSEYYKKVWDRATTYHLVHTAAALSTLSLQRSFWGKAACFHFVLGNALFAGSLYALVITEDSHWARIAPYGGGAFLAGWASVCLAQGPPEVS